jgi:redox-sensitive bicupin YhaK (pirin superfamily)
MLEVRKSGERGYADHGWLKSRHTFSFADYYHPEHNGFGVLRVINEDQVSPGTGFGRHGHKDMEILSYVLEGQLEHRDSMGNSSVIVPGDVQRMSAGTGVLHSETNPSAKDPVHFLQIWIRPNVQGIQPSYEQKHFPASVKHGRLRLVASHDGADGSVGLHQDVRIYAGLFNGNERDVLQLAPARKAYVHVARGRVSANGIALEPGDGLKVADVQSVELSGGQTAELLVFDLPG